jgi:tight adherence protein C
MVIALLLGTGCGLGLLLVVRGLRARPIPLAVVVSRLDRPASGIQSPSRIRRRGASWWADLIASRASETTSVQQRDLAVLQRSAERHVVDKLTTSLSLAGLAVAAGVLFPTLGIGISPGFAAISALVALGVGYVIPDGLLKRHAAARREQFRHALSSYLDLVNVLLAGGAGVETALEASADAGDGWVFETIRDSLVRARLTRRSPWTVFGEVGAELGIDELVELASSLQLAGEHGARVRSSLSARAASLRGHQMANVEAAANSASERMGVPTVVMFMAFLALLAYPAIVKLGGS